MAGHYDVHQTVLHELEPGGKICVVMLEVTQPFMHTCNEAAFKQVKHMFAKSRAVIWITSGGAVECRSPLNALITGLARTARRENRLTKVMTVDIEPNQESPDSIAPILLKLLDNNFTAATDSTSLEFEYAVRNGRILLPRMVEDEEFSQYVSGGQDVQASRKQKFFQDGRSLALKIGNPGLLGTMVWAERATPKTINDDEIRVELTYGALNFRDLMVALGQLEDFAEEFSGIVTDVGQSAHSSFQIGDRVCGVGGGAYANSSVVSMYNAQVVPATMPLDTAASIPVAYTTAYYSLVTVANLQKGESVLIHSAAGGLGQAAMMIARHIGAIIYVTIGNSKKKSFIMSNFSIPEKHIFSSRLTTFSSGIKRLTSGKGVDVILNSLSADTVRESCACIAKFGRFIEVGKKDASVNARLEMEMFGRHVMFASVDLAFIYTERRLLFKKLLGDVFKLLEEGAVGQIRPIEVMPLDDIEAAFRLMQTGKHMGKIVLKAEPTTQVKVCLLSPFSYAIMQKVPPK